MAKRLSYQIRQYAALHAIARSSMTAGLREGLTSTEIAKLLKISQPYARKLAESWRASGIVDRRETPYRNTVRVTYFIAYGQIDRYRTKGYQQLSESAWSEVLLHNYRNDPYNRELF